MSETERSMLASVGLLAKLPGPVLDDLAATASRLRLDAGARLFEEGDRPEHLSVVMTGRLRVASADGTVEREVGHGECVGEMGVLTGEPRAATVLAIRDTEVVQVPADAIMRAIAAAPSMIQDLTRLVVLRLRQPRPAPHADRVVGVAQVGVSSARPGDDITEALVAAIARHGVDVVCPGRDGTPDPAVDKDLHALVERVEAGGNGVVVLPLDDRTSWWDEECAQQCDLILLCATATASPPRPEHGVVRLLDRLRRAGVTPRRELVLVHPARSTRPAPTTARWLDAVEVGGHHHVRAGDRAHADRLARHLLGRTVGLVLSGGGARGIAHVGVYRALQELGIPIDHVGGSSIGAVMATQIADEPDPAALAETNREQFTRADFGRRVTLPVLSVLSIRRVLPLFESLFGDRDLADRWVPCFVTTVDLTDCELQVRDRGPAARWTRASASPPGLWPPVVDAEGHLIVDGGLFDNLPVGPMAARGADRVIAVNVSASRALLVDPEVGEIDTWTGFARNLAQRRVAYPHLATILTRMGLATSLPATVRSADEADLLIEPAVQQYGLATYKPFDDIVEAGYRAAVDALDGWDRPTA